MELTQYRDRLKEFTSKKDVEWEEFLAYFKVSNPEPVYNQIEMRVVEKKIVSMDIKFYLALLSGLGALALSGFRVSERFYKVAGGETGGIFSVGEAISAVLAVNITIFALSIAYAYTNRKMSESSQTWGLGTAVLLAAMAGLGQAFSKLGVEWSGFVSFFDLALAFTLGIGATLLEYFSGDLLGVEIVRYFSEKESAEDKYKTELQQAKDEFDVKSKQNEHEYAEQFKAWVRLAKQQFPSWKSSFEQWNSKVEKERTPTQVLPERKQNRTRQSSGTTFADVVNDTIARMVEQNKDVPQFGELSSVLARMYAEQDGVSQENLDNYVRLFIQKKKGQISELRKKWVQNYTV